jgi:hypothetical protein
MKATTEKTIRYWLLLLATLLLAAPAHAQVLPGLVGQWQAYEIGFTVAETVPDSVRERLNDSQTADLNHGIAEGTAQLRVEFRADGSYRFIVMRGEETVQNENGIYSVTNGRLRASSPSSPNGSSFDGQQIRKLNRRVLLLSFPIGEQMPGVEEEVEYRRVK